MKKISKSIIKTKKWEDADFRFTDLFSNLSSPFQFQKPFTETDILLELEQILSNCPEYYPALLDYGLRKIHVEKEKAEADIEKGFNIMLQLQPKKQQHESIEIFIDNIEIKWRFDLSIKYLLILIDKLPNNAFLYDACAYAYHIIGDYKNAIKFQKTALKIEPSNIHYNSNLGWYYMFTKEYNNAEIFLKTTLQINASDEIAINNLKINEFLSTNNLSYIDFLLQKPDYDKIYNFDDEIDDFDELNRTVSDNNNKKFAALKYNVVSKNNINYSEYAVSISSLEAWFKFILSISQDIFLYEDIHYIDLNFKPIMHKFIFKHSDVDLQILNEIYSGLNYYYGFLTEEKIIKKHIFDDFIKNIQNLKKELEYKVIKYKEIRNNHKYSDSEKEKIREELFEGDHSFPFL